MKMLEKAAVLAVVCFGSVIAFQHARMGMSAAIPKDMPQDSRFLPAGLDLAANVQEGDWIACRVDAQQQTDWCRVTDQQGMVVYQGDFLPVGSPTALPSQDLQVASVDPRKIWVRGPAEAAPVPVIPLASGNLLVPAADRDALRQRWSSDSTEYDQLPQGR